MTALKTRKNLGQNLQNLLEKSFGSVLEHLKDIVQNLIGGYLVFP